MKNDAETAEQMRIEIDRLRQSDKLVRTVMDTVDCRGLSGEDRYVHVATARCPDTRSTDESGGIMMGQSDTASEQLARALWDAVFGKGAWDTAERCNAHRELRSRWVVAITPFCQPLEKQSAKRLPVPYSAEEIADELIRVEHGIPQYFPRARAIRSAVLKRFCAPPAEPKREPLPYTAEEIADDILRANGCAPRHYPRTRAHTVAAVAKFCAPPASTSKEDDPEAPVYKKGHEPKAIVTAHFTAESQRYPAPSGFAALLAEPLPEDGCYSDQTEPTLDEIRALAAKHGMVLRPLSKTAQDVRKPLPPAILADILQDTVHKEVGRTRLAKTARSLTVQFLAPDARFGSGK